MLKIKKKFPHITGSLVYQKLIEEGSLKACTASLSSVLRYIRLNHLSVKELNQVDRQPFEMAHANDLWQADTSHGPTLKINGTKKITPVIILDEAQYLKTEILNDLKLSGIEKSIFSSNSYEALASCTSGAIRKLNSLVEKCLILGYQKEVGIIDTEIIVSAKKRL